MPNFSGTWTARQQMQARGASTWPAPPGVPTIGTASVTGATSVSVAFTSPACVGYPVATYVATSTPGCITSSGASSPLSVTGLTTGTSYTFKVKATNTQGTSACSSSSNSVVPAVIGQVAYTTPGIYSWVAPANVTSVSVVAVGGGNVGCNYGGGGGGGGLGYRNNYSVTPGSSYTLQVGSGGRNPTACGAKDSYFVSTAVVLGGAGLNGACGASYAGTGGGNGGPRGTNTACYAGQAGGGGAGGYAGAGGKGISYPCGIGRTAGAGGGGGGGGATYGGGGVGILGQGSNGSIATSAGGGGSGGTDGKAVNGVCTSGGNYGGGSGGGAGGSQKAATGAVRIIWPGNSRTFPSTCTGDK